MYFYISENYYNKENITVVGKSEAAISDFINNAQILVLHCFVSDDNVACHTKVYFSFCARYAFHIF